jgi:hypothetical protein
VPRAFGGNLDNKELVPGSTLYLPVFVEGGLFSCGDGHGAQGDGEVCVTAIETALEGASPSSCAKTCPELPRAETPTHHITMGIDPDLDHLRQKALRDMIVLLGGRPKLSREEAYMLCSLAADLRVTQTVNGSKGVHCMLAKSRRRVGSTVRMWSPKALAADEGLSSANSRAMPIAGSGGSAVETMWRSGGTAVRVRTLMAWPERAMAMRPARLLLAKATRYRRLAASMASQAAR